MAWILFIALIPSDSRASQRYVITSASSLDVRGLHRARRGPDHPHPRALVLNSECTTSACALRIPLESRLLHGCSSSRSNPRLHMIFLRWATSPHTPRAQPGFSNDLPGSVVGKPMQEIETPSAMDPTMALGGCISFMGLPTIVLLLSCSPALPLSRSPASCFLPPALPLSDCPPLPATHTARRPH